MGGKDKQRDEAEPQKPADQQRSPADRLARERIKEQLDNLRKQGGQQ